MCSSSKKFLNLKLLGGVFYLISINRLKRMEIKKVKVRTYGYD